MDTLQLDGHLFAQDVSTLGGDTVAICRRGPTPSGTVAVTGERIAYLHTDHLGAVVKATDTNR